MNIPTILVVDDDAEVRGFIQLVLESAHYKVLEARDASSAFSILTNVIPDLILLDIMLPEMNGFQMCEEIKKNPTLSFVPVIFVTAMATIEALKKAVGVKAQGFLEKPLDPTEFLKKIEEALKGHYAMPTHLKGSC